MISIKKRKKENIKNVLNIKLFLKINLLQSTTYLFQKSEMIPTKKQNKKH
jgi:hypothetical protein